ncbi:OPT oligopeptide transporter protein-domain-containing protein [Kockiozyma suomiensis]|uniref:OPT oligopeptide transporter protein-domain-containing protein n=1 Tax=Kockiozyma suomiensis TaxID=1337062 RepID=UPI0033435ECE
MEKNSSIISTSLVSENSAYNEKLQEKISVQPVFTVDQDFIVDRLNHSGDATDVISEGGDSYIFDAIRSMSLEEAKQILLDAVELHDNDYNFPEETLDKIKLLLQGPEAYSYGEEAYEVDIRLEASLIKYHSPYPEVRSCTEPFDDPDVPVETIRSYFLGFCWVVVGAFVNETLGEPRQPSINISSTVMQILLYPCGKLAERLPNWKFRILGKTLELNPGPWSAKEQMFATIILNAGGHYSNLVNYAMALKLDVFFGVNWVNFGFLFLMNVSTQFFGLGMAGVLRRWVIYPVNAVWPTILPTIMLNRALLVKEKPQSINGWTIPKIKFFYIVLIASFLYFFFPDFIFTALSTFNWMTWIAPQNLKLAIITGSTLGLGFNPISTFDWAVIKKNNPMVRPFFAVANQYIGVIISAFVILIMYWTNYKNTAYLPINTSSTYDNTGVKYNTSRVLTDGRFDKGKYDAYSPPYITAGHLILYGATYVTYTISFVFTFLTEWKTLKMFIKRSFRKSSFKIPGSWNEFFNPGEDSIYEGFNDPFTREMKKYKEVPDWWFVLILIASFVFGVIGVAVYPSQTPVWVVIVMIAMGIALLIPTSIIYAVTGYQLEMNELASLICGYIIPGNGVGNVISRLYGYNTDAQSETFIGDIKMAHYMKIPPRAVFRGQFFAVLVQVFVTIAAIYVVLGLPEICTPTQPNKFTCPYSQGIYTAAVLYGIIGPDRVLNDIYPEIKYCFLIGACLGVAGWAARRYFPKQLKYFHPCVIVSGFTIWGTGYNVSYYTPGFIVSWVFTWYIKRRYLPWWTKYNYILASALTAGVAFSAIVIFAGLQYQQISLSWWGNKVSKAGIDGTANGRLYEIPERGYFGRAPGEF